MRILILTKEYPPDIGGIATAVRSIALALIEAAHALTGGELLVGVRDRRLRAKIVKPPFVKR